MNSPERLAEKPLTILRKEILAAQGREIVAVGRIDQQGSITKVKILARGTPDAAPAVLSALERGDVVLHNHPSGNLSPSGADLKVASELGSLGVGFVIMDNPVEHLYWVVEPVLRKKIRKLEVEKLSSLLSPEGKMAELEGYEYRGAQVEMLRLVSDSMNAGTSCAVEAGTGVGKSLAYLLPSVEWAAVNGERVVVSTATINLQQQLIERDIPLVKELLHRDLKAVLVKGRGNYLCRRRLDQQMEEQDLFSEDDEELKALKAWSQVTETGSKSDLSFFPRDELWNSVCSDSEICLGLRCAYRENCFFLRARREAAAAGLLVVNHHLLFSDLSLRLSSSGFEGTAVLPPFKKIVFDEAHTIERSATSYFSESFSRYSLERILSRIHRVKKGRVLGLMYLLGGLGKRRDVLDAIPREIDSLMEHMNALDTLALDLLRNESAFRFHPADSPDRYTGLLDELREVERGVKKIAEILSEGLEGLEDDEEEESPLLYEAKQVMRRLKIAGGVCAGFGDYPEKTDKIFFIEALRGKRKSARFTIAPLDITDIMKKAVFEPFSSIVFTSATLAVRDDFTYWRKRSGLSDQELALGIFSSPYPYDRNVLLGIPTDAPPPASPEYVSFLSDFLGKVLEVSEGGALVLFTSYAMMREVWERTREGLTNLGISVSKQGDDDRGRLLSRFREDTGSVLFATDSFWEGVDTPGDALKVLILCRLPFRVPSDPVIAARQEAVEAAGGNAFKDISLPDAVTRFKQGFGRLIRRSSDRGVVLVTDNRILTKPYGRMFLESVPKTERSTKESGYLLEDVETFLYRQQT
ncbi:MAG: hypothetical protein JW760_04280 [Spirochaetales bacterium]|nr:hypothetical protein [Spirochaetales bacterium]